MIKINNSLTTNLKQKIEDIDTIPEILIVNRCNINNSLRRLINDELLTKGLYELKEEVEFRGYKYKLELILVDKESDTYFNSGDNTLLFTYDGLKYSYETKYNKEKINLAQQNWNLESQKNLNNSIYLYIRTDLIKDKSIKREQINLNQINKNEIKKILRELYNIDNIDLFKILNYAEYLTINKGRYFLKDFDIEEINKYYYKIQELKKNKTITEIERKQKINNILKIMREIIGFILIDYYFIIEDKYKSLPLSLKSSSKKRKILKTY